MSTVLWWLVTTLRVCTDAISKRVTELDLRAYLLNNFALTHAINTSMDQVFRPPSSVRGLKRLDREMFKKTIQVPWMEIDNANISQALGKLKKYFLKLPNFKPIEYPFPQEGKNQNVKTVLDPRKITCYDDISLSDRENLKILGISKINFHIGDLQLTYENWRADEIIKAIAPEDKDSSSSFSKIGHIVHLNLRDHLLEYKHIIGNVYLDKVSSTRTVVNKVDIIDSTYRNFKMEVLSGDEDLIATVRENGCSFQFDFSTVYWNPRLCTEHERIVAMLRPGDVLYDVFAGVGPFSIPAAKKKCTVLANDLNPESFRWIQINAKLNKVKEDLLQVFNKDGAEFIKCDLRNHYLADQNDPDRRYHITMNLPAMALDFLNAFRHLYTEKEVEMFTNKLLPTVHVYFFAHIENFNADLSLVAKEIVEDKFGIELGPSLKEITKVRNVSPKKEMMRVSFDLTKEILFSAKRPLQQDANRNVSVENVGDANEERETKKLCSSK